MRFTIYIYMDENHIANVKTEPHPHHWRLFIIVLLIIGIYVAFRGLKTTSQKFEEVANTPAPNQGQVTEEEKATIDAIRHAPPVDLQ